MKTGSATGKGAEDVGNKVSDLEREDYGSQAVGREMHGARVEVPEGESGSSDRSNSSDDRTLTEENKEEHKDN